MLAFIRGYRRGHSKAKERIETRYVVNSISSSSIWFYQHKAIAILMHKNGQRWLYLRDGGSLSLKPVFSRLNRIIHQYELGHFDQIGRKRKTWVLFQNRTQYFIPWKGQMIFTTNVTPQVGLRMPLIVDRIREIIPKNFTKNPFWEKDISWKPVEHP
jgi:hypothetical protein